MKTMLEFECPHCGMIKQRLASQYRHSIRKGRVNYCSNRCSGLAVCGGFSKDQKVAATNLQIGVGKTVKSDITPEILSQLVDYNPLTGEMFWKPRPLEYFLNDRDQRTWNTLYSGRLAFNNINRAGYFQGMIFRVMLSAHRVIWALHYGEWPSKHIDHMNRVRTDNRICNLRNVSHAENMRNRPCHEYPVGTDFNHPAFSQGAAGAKNSGGVIQCAA